MNLKSYGSGLAQKPELVALNKADAMTPEQIKQQTARLKRAAGKSPFVLSAVTRRGVPEVLRALMAAIEQAPGAEARHGEPAAAQ